MISVIAGRYMLRTESTLSDEDGEVDSFGRSTSGRGIPFYIYTTYKSPEVLLPEYRSDNAFTVSPCSTGLALIHLGP